MDVDHINHDILDNRKCNLRVVTRQENLRNKQNVKGYCYDKKRNKWQAYINVNYKMISLGRYDTECEAKQVREEAEIKYFGEHRYRGN